METLHKRVAGIDVHRMKHVVTVLIEDDSGQTIKSTRPLFTNCLHAHFSTLSSPNGGR
jgi:hypothetical protein